MAISKITSAGVDPNSIATNGANGAIDVNASAPADSVVIDSNGGMHIGTTSTYGTNSKLSISGTVTAADTGIVLSDGATTTIGLALATPSTGSVPYIFGNNNLAFGSNGAERMRIDSAGRVTTPYQPAFNAYFTTDFSLPVGAGTIAYNSVSYNVGSHYNQSNGRFTAPVSGLYWFMHKLNTNATITWETKIYKNGGEIIRSYQPDTSSNVKTSIATSVVYLNAGDYVTADRYQPNGNSQTFFGSSVPNVQSHFSGYLLF